jgi:small subunit ribosomal protein S17
MTQAQQAGTERVARRELTGTVLNASNDKTIVVRVDRWAAHPTYKKIVKRTKKYHAHDDKNMARKGDVVRIVKMTRPLSKLKRWRLKDVVRVDEREA